VDDDSAMLGPGTSSASPGVEDFVRLVSFDLSGTAHFRLTGSWVTESQRGNVRLISPSL